MLARALRATVYIYLYSLSERPDGGARTSVDDFAMLCPNCHAEIHLPREAGAYRSVEELRGELLTHNE